MAPGALFFCVPGFMRDGHDFAREAISRRGARNRATADPGDPQIQVTSVRAAMAAAAAFHGDPTARMRVVGGDRYEPQDADGV